MATYETSLSPEKEAAFLSWKSKYAPNDSGQDYDLRGAFSAGLTPGENGHWPDTYKKPNHPTFSVESIYAKDAPDQAGSWDGENYIPNKNRMGFVAETLTNPEWENKPALEKAAARKDLFLRSLEDNPAYKQKFNDADAAGQKSIYDDWNTAVQAKFPDAWTTPGYEIGRQGNSTTLTAGRVPVRDYKTESILAALQPVTRSEGDKDPRKEAIAELTPEQKKAILPYYAQRYANLQSSDLGDINKDLAPDFNWKELGKTAGVSALRMGPVLLASPTRDTKTIAAASVLGEAMAQNAEQYLGRREGYDIKEGALNAAFNLINPVKMNPTASAATRLIGRSAEGAALATGQNIINQAIHGKVPSLNDLGDSFVIGSIFGGGLEGAGQLSSAIRTRLLGKTPQAIQKELPNIIANAAPEEKQALTDLQAHIEQSLNPSSEAPKAVDSASAFIAGENTVPAKTAAESADTFTTQLTGETTAQRAAASPERAQQLDQARAEQTASEVVAASADLPQAIAANQISQPETTVLGEDIAKNQITAAQTRRGESRREVARRQSELDSNAPKVDVDIPENIQLSPQAMQMMDKYGRVSPTVLTSLAGGTAGAVYGSTQGDSIEERAKNALIYGTAGLGLGAAAGKGLSSLASEDGQILAKKLARDLPELIEKAPAAMKEDLRSMQANLKRLAPAVFIGIQEGVPAAGIPNRELYNLTENAAGTVTNSTVSRETLEKAGFRVPKTPEKYVAGQRYEVPVEQFDVTQPVPPDTQVTVMQMGDRKAIQVDIPGGENGRPLFSGSVQDAINAGYDINLPADLSEGRFTYDQINAPSNEQQSINATTPEGSAQSNDQSTSSRQEIPRGQPEVGEQSSQGNQSIDAGLTGLSSQAGFITPGLIRNALAPGAGAIAGVAYGANEGDTPMERAANAMKWGLMGFGAASVGARLAIPGTKNIRTFAKELAQGTDALPEWFQKIRDTEPLLALRRTIGNNPWADLKKDVSAVARTGATIEEKANPYLAARLFPGRVDALVKQNAEEAAQSVKRQIDESLDTLAKASGKTYDEYAQDFQDYVVAKTAKDYNREHASFGPDASGMTDQRADQIVSDIQSRGIDKVFEDLRKQVRQLDDMALTVREQTGLISKAQADALRKKYPEHIPLNREIDDAEDGVASVYGVPRFNSPRSGIIAGKGSKKEVADVLTSTLVNLKDAIIRGERNQVGQTVREFYKENPNSAVVVSRASTGQVPKNAIAVRYNEGGENRTDWVEFKNKYLADSLRNMNAEVTNPFLRGIGRATNVITQLATRFSPSFFLASNPLRDRQEVFANLATSGDIREAARSTILSNPFKYMKGVSDAELGRSSPLADLHREAAVNGAFTGGLANANRETAEANLEKVSLDRSFLKKTGDVFGGAINYLNNVMNDSNFLRIYERGKKAGLSDKEAAMLTRNASIDFNLKTPLVKSMGAFYGFLSPGIHGATTAAKNVIRNPRTIAEVGAGLAGVAVAVDAWNSQQDPDWKKKKMLDFYRRNSIPVALGSDEGGTYYLTVPVAQSIRPIKGAVDMVSDLANGSTADPSLGAKRMAEIMADSMSPLGSGDFTQTITPTIADPLMDIERNTSYNQGRIYPGYSKSGLDIERVNDRTLTTSTGQGALESAKMLKKMGFDVSPESILYAVRGYGGGPASTALKAVDLAGSNADHKQSRGAADWPVISSFIKYVPKDAPQIATESDKTLDDSLEIQAYREIDRKQTRAENMDTLRNTKIDPQTKADIIIKRIGASSNPERAKDDVVNGLKKSVAGGTNPRSADILKLEVDTGDRAQYIFNALKAQTPEMRIKYIESLPAEALSPKVQQQIMALMQASAVQPGRN